MNDDEQEYIQEIEDIIRTFYEDAQEEGILRINAITDMKEFLEFLEIWATSYCQEKISED